MSGNSTNVMPKPTMSTNSSSMTSTPTMPTMPTMPKMPTMGETLNMNGTLNMTGGKKKPAKKSTGKKSTTKKESSKKKGGALMDDVKNLAVPFAILLAKQGLQAMFDKKKSKKGGEVELSASSASKVNSQRRRATIVGGSCGTGSCGAQQIEMPQIELPQMGGKPKKTVKKTPLKARKGGAEEQEAGARAQQVKNRFEKLSKEIDEFLQKY